MDHSIFHSYVRIRKASSTTLASINLRLAHNNIANFTGVTIKGTSQKYQLKSRCATTYDHVPAHILDIQNRIKNSTFLWTFVRDPASRSISHFFYFSVSKEQKAPTDTRILTYLTHPSTRDVQLKFTYPKYIQDEERIPSTSEVKSQVQEILDEYDFIGECLCCIFVSCILKSILIFMIS